MEGRCPKAQSQPGRGDFPRQHAARTAHLHEGSSVPKTNLSVRLRVRVPGETASRRRACACAHVCAGACVSKELCRKVMAHAVNRRAETCGTGTRHVTTRSGVELKKGSAGGRSRKLHLLPGESSSVQVRF